MKLLIVTQVIDSEHPILGFFHRWVEEFAVHCEHVHVICLQAGAYNLPANVTVHTLGKEAGKGKLTYLVRFYSLIFTLRHEYNSVFVHMNQIYVILGAPFWRTWGKLVGLWYAHGAVSNSLKLAVRMANRVFTSTEEGLRIVTAKRIVVGQGIDTKMFTPTEKKSCDNLRLITVGRISQSKNIETLLRAGALLKQDGVLFSFKIVGVPLTPEDSRYTILMKNLAQELSIEDRIEWVGGLPNHLLPAMLQHSDLFIHDGSTNSLDKVLLEAALCGCIVVSSNPAYGSLTRELAPEYVFAPHDEKALVSIIKNFSQYTENMLKVKGYFKENYSIARLISAIVSEY